MGRHVFNGTEEPGFEERGQAATVRKSEEFSGWSRGFSCLSWFSYHLAWKLGSLASPCVSLPRGSTWGVYQAESNLCNLDGLTVTVVVGIRKKGSYFATFHALTFQSHCIHYPILFLWPLESGYVFYYYLYSLQLVSEKRESLEVEREPSMMPKVVCCFSTSPKTYRNVHPGSLIWPNAQLSDKSWHTVCNLGIPQNLLAKDYSPTRQSGALFINCSKVSCDILNAHAFCCLSRTDEPLS